MGQTSSFYQIDGGYHADPIQAWKDGLRTGRLIIKNNVKNVVRFSNEEILIDVETVIRKLCREILPQCAKFGV